MPAWSVPGIQRARSPRHAPPAGENIHLGVLEHVAHVQAAGNVGRRQQHGEDGRGGGFFRCAADRRAFLRPNRQPNDLQSRRGRRLWADHEAWWAFFFQYQRVSLSYQQGVRVLVPPLRFASVGMTNSLGCAKGSVDQLATADPSSFAGMTTGAAFLLCGCCLDRATADPSSFPGFPVEILGVDKTYAAFLTESRTRGRFQACCVTGNPGSLGMTNRGGCVFPQ